MAAFAEPASPKKDADARNKRGHGGRRSSIRSGRTPGARPKKRDEETRSRERDKGAQSMAKVVFTPNIQRHVALPEAEASGRTVRDVLEAVFTDNPQGRGYVLDDQSGLRKHMTIFVDGRMIRDRARLTDAVSDSSTVYVFQALSGG
jgi:molybdopterin synthase sulfur carrier subunit